MNVKIENTSLFCRLCQTLLPTHSIVDGINKFCCRGCQAVFNILSARNQLIDFENHPVFQQALQSGLVSNPELLEHIHQQKKEFKEEHKESFYMEINEMWCPSCAEIIRLMLLKEKGVFECSVDYTTDLASVKFFPRFISKERIEEIIEKLGYRSAKIQTKEQIIVSKELYLRFGIAAFCSLNVMMFAYPLYATYFDYDGEEYGRLFAWLSFFISLPVLFYSATPIWRRFLSSVKLGIFGMESLVAIGVGAAFGVSTYELWRGGTYVYYDSMTVIIALVLLGKIIETKAKFSAKESMLRLSLAVPRRGRKKFPNGDLAYVLVKEIYKNDVLVVYQGEKITLDGQVIEGGGTCDESLMTGEATPVVKKIGDTILGGTILIQGSLTYKIIQEPKNTALQAIIELIEQDISHKTIYVRAADHIIRWFVPLVIFIAVFTGFISGFYPSNDDLFPFQTAFLRVLSVLLISCPCAIGIAAPTAESHILHRLAQQGAIVRNRGCLVHLGKESVILFDKTGTVTEGHFTVQEGLNLLSPQDCNALYSLTLQSLHPVACAIGKALEGAQKILIKDVEEVIGYGMCALVEGKKYYVGSARFLEQVNIPVKEKKKI